MDIWNGVPVYEEANFDRKILREGKYEFWEETTGGPALGGDLIHDQLSELIDGLPLPDRSRDLLRLRLEGWTLRESAEKLGISRQRVERIWTRTLRRIPPTLEEMEEMLDPDRTPHYGWQEAYLDSQRLR